MEDLHRFMTEVVKLAKKAQSNYHHTIRTIKEDEACLKHLHDDLSSSVDTLSREMMEDLEKMQQVLRLAAQHGDPIKAWSLLDSFKACFNNTNRSFAEAMAKSKQRQFNETRHVMKDFLAAKREEMLNVRVIYSDYLSSISSETATKSLASCNSHGSGREERDWLLESLQDIASTLPPPKTINQGQMYAVLENSDRKWYRATVGHPFGKFQVGDEPVETLYYCYLIDIDQHQRISEREMRVLPEYLAELPPLAEQSSPDSSKHRDWAAISTNLLKELPQRDMINTEEKPTIQTVSVQESVRQTDAPKKFLPKYGESKGQLYSLRHAPVFIMSASLLTHVYVRIVDGDYPLYRKMMQELQEEFRSVTPKCASFCPSPVTGHAYAAQFGATWYRVLIEEMEDKRKMVFQVDIGFRQIVLPFMTFHKLPDKFMVLPTQAIRCVMDGVFSTSTNSCDKKNVNYRQNQFLAKFKGKPAVAFFNLWQGHEVGHVKRFGPRELTVNAVLYPKDNIHCSINMMLANTSMVRLRDEPIEFQEHYEICRRLVSQNAWSTSLPHLEASSEETVLTEHLDSKKPIKDVQNLLNKEELVTVPDKTSVENGLLFSTSKRLPQSSAKKKSTSTKATPLSKTLLIHLPNPPNYEKKPIQDFQPKAVVQDVSIMRDDFLFSSSNRFPKTESVNGSIRAKSTMPIVEVSSSDSCNETDSASFFTIDDNENEKKIANFSGFQEEETVPVTFVKCQSPDNIFFRTPELVKKFIRVQNALHSFFSARKTPPSEEATIKFTNGLLCIVHYEGKWFRAEVIDMKKFYPNISVFLLDVGYPLNVSASDVYRLPEELAKLPRTVLRCSLYGIGPLSETEWDEKATKHIIDLLERADRIVLGRRKEPNSSEGEPNPVIVYFSRENKVPVINLNNQLVALGLASFDRAY